MSLACFPTTACSSDNSTSKPRSFRSCISSPCVARAAALDCREPLQRIRRVDVEEIDDVFGGDAFPYGIEANRATLQALVAYMVEQHFIARPTPIEDLFVPLAGAIGT